MFRLEDGIAALQAGELVVYPTETFYAIGADAFSSIALRRLFGLKRREPERPVGLIAADTAMAFSVAREIPSDARRLADAFWPGPLTIVFHASDAVLPELTQGKGTIGIRIPSCAVCLRLLELVGGPITSTSANLSGDSPLETIASMRAVLTPGIDLYLDAGVLPPSKPSTVLDVTGSSPRILREGAIAGDAIRSVVPEFGVVR
jgi:L-threonylcarbamoyladenylate synthase